MKPGKRMTGPQWLLLSLLLLGVVGMHHFVPTDAHDPASTMVATAMAGVSGADPMHLPEGPAPSPDHDSQHLCMAVLSAAAGLLLVAFLLTLSWQAPVPLLQRVRYVRRVDRPPGLSGRTLLNSVCVSRV
jgi:hypothetical protein